MKPLDFIAAHSRELPVTRVRLVGIYFLLRQDEVVYVGQSTDIENRLALHRTHGIRDFDRAFWIEVAPADLDAYEGAFIRALDPIESLAAPANRGRDFEILARFGLEPNAEACRSFEKRRAEQWGSHRRHPRTA